LRPGLSRPWSGSSSSKGSRKSSSGFALKKNEKVAGSVPEATPRQTVGPLNPSQHVQRMSDLIATAVSRGAKVFMRGVSRPISVPAFLSQQLSPAVDASMNYFRGDVRADPGHANVRDAKEAIVRANDSPFCSCQRAFGQRINQSRGQSIAAELRRRRSDGERRDQLFRYAKLRTAAAPQAAGTHARTAGCSKWSG